MKTTERVVRSVTDLVGHTPLFELCRAPRGGRLLLKLEQFNPTGAAKIRMAISMVDDAERRGLLRPGGKIVESTSGNTGLGLSVVAAERGYRFSAVVDNHACVDKLRAMAAMGAELTFVAADGDDVLATSAREDYAERLAAQQPDAYFTEQHNNDANAVSYHAVAHELLGDLPGGVDYLISPVGTGGSLFGTARELAALGHPATVVGVEPHGSIAFGGPGHDYWQSGTGTPEGAVVGTAVDYDLLDEGVKVGDIEAFATVRVIARRRGLLLGGSAGGAIYAALERLPMMKPGATAVTTVCDGGEKYLDTVFSDEWMSARHLLSPATENRVEEMLDDVIEGTAVASGDALPSTVWRTAIRSRRRIEPRYRAARRLTPQPGTTTRRPGSAGGRDTARTDRPVDDRHRDDESARRRGTCRRQPGRGHLQSGADDGRWSAGADGQSDRRRGHRRPTQRIDGSRACARRVSRRHAGRNSRRDCHHRGGGVAAVPRTIAGSGRRGTVHAGCARTRPRPLSVVPGASTVHRRYAKASGAVVDHRWIGGGQRRAEPCLHLRLGAVARFGSHRNRVEHVTRLSADVRGVLVDGPARRGTVGVVVGALLAGRAGRRRVAAETRRPGVGHLRQRGRDVHRPRSGDGSDLGTGSGRTRRRLPDHLHRVPGRDRTLAGFVDHRQPPGRSPTCARGDERHATCPDGECSSRHGGGARLPTIPRRRARPIHQRRRPTDDRPLQVTADDRHRHAVRRRRTEHRRGTPARARRYRVRLSVVVDRLLGRRRARRTDPGLPARTERGRGLVGTHVRSRHHRGPDVDAVRQVGAAHRRQCVARVAQDGIGAYSASPKRPSERIGQPWRPCGGNRVGRSYLVDDREGAQ
ncbi:cystathionine beta-synthase [Gordonia polyisoprenivorans NBRC 16320 = JCM 10675]|nr:cystathionine beta-synthase [Gordonia polyisoprenivorans NBRC 16320 = JCM 10675]